MNYFPSKVRFHGAMLCVEDSHDMIYKVNKYTVTAIIDATKIYHCAVFTF